jgi:hypothetical protein
MLPRTAMSALPTMPVGRRDFLRALTLMAAGGAAACATAVPSPSP